MTSFPGYAEGDSSALGLTVGAFDGGAGLGHQVEVDPSGLFGGVQLGYDW